MHDKTAVLLEGEWLCKMPPNEPILRDESTRIPLAASIFMHTDQMLFFRRNKLSNVGHLQLIPHICKK